MLAQKVAPGWQAPRVVAAIPECQRTWDPASLRKLEVDDVDVAVVAHVPAEISEKRRDGIVVKVMQQAVDEDEVIRPLSWNRVGADVCDLEVRAVPSSRMLRCTTG